LSTLSAIIRGQYARQKRHGAQNPEGAKANLILIPIIKIPDRIVLGVDEMKVGVNDNWAFCRARQFIPNPQPLPYEFWPGLRGSTIGRIMRRIAYTVYGSAGTF